MFWTVTLSLLEGLVVLLRIFAMTLLFSLPLGLLIAFGSMSKWAPLRALRHKHPKLAAFRPVSGLFNLIVWVIRGTPLMLQLIIIYYGPGMWFDNNIWGGGSGGRLTACIVAFVINYACYFSEIFRGGIQGIPSGQYEAGQVLGMTKSQIFFKVTLLQVIKRVIPPMGNEFINLVKDTALARTIAVYEVLWMGEKFIKSAGIIWPLFYTAVFYLLFNGILTLLFGWIEKKMDYFK